MEGDTSLADKKKETTLKANCHQYELDYNDPKYSSLDKQARWKAIENAIRNERKKRQRTIETPEKKRSRLDNQNNRQGETRANATKVLKASSVRLLPLQLPTKNKVRLHCSYVWLYFLSGDTNCILSVSRSKNITRTLAYLD